MVGMKNCITGITKFIATYNTLFQTLHTQKNANYTYYK